MKLKEAAKKGSSQKVVENKSESIEKEHDLIHT